LENTSKVTLKNYLLLGIPWIDEMKCVPYTLHQCKKFINEGKLTCVKADPKPFQYCNFIPSCDDFLSSTHLVPFVPPSTSNVVTYSHIVNDNVFTSSNVVVCSEVPSSGESSGKAIISYTSPQVGEYKLQNKIFNLPTIPSLRDMVRPSSSLPSKESYIKPMSFIKENNVMSTTLEASKEPHRYFSSCFPPKNLSKLSFA